MVVRASSMTAWLDPENAVVVMAVRVSSPSPSEWAHRRFHGNDGLAANRNCQLIIRGMTSQGVIVAALLAVATALDSSWVAEYGSWRTNDRVSVQEWQDNTPLPVAAKIPRVQLEAMSEDDGVAAFDACISKQAGAFTDHVLKYKSPRLTDIAAVVRRELDKRCVGGHAASRQAAVVAVVCSVC